jgi:hypothetical protein
MSRIFKRLINFGRDNRGSYTAEFIMLMPLFVFLFAGSFVFWDAFMSKNRALKATYVIGDILSRQDVTSNNYIEGLGVLQSRLVVSDGTEWLRVTSVRYVDDVYEVVWSYSTDGEAVLTTDDLDAGGYDENHLPLMASNDSVLIAETFTPYEPPFNTDITDKIYENIIVTRPRYVAELANTDFP